MPDDQEDGSGVKGLNKPAFFNFVFDYLTFNSRYQRITTFLEGVGWGELGWGGEGRGK